MSTHKKIITKALKIRFVEEKLLQLFNENKLNGTVHTCVGQELIGVCLSEYLSNTDMILSNHRGHGHFFSRSNKLKEFFAELMGRKDGLCGGMGGSQHLYDGNFMTNGIQGGMTPIAAGIAYAKKYNKTNDIVVSFIGDGTLGQGLIYESFNIAAKWKLPVMYVLENNSYAQSTSLKQTFAGDIQKRAEGFGLQYIKTNSWDIEHMKECFAKASEAVRNNTPVFVEVETYRLNSHSKGDDNRHETEIEQYYAKDILVQAMKSKEYDDDIASIKAEIDSAAAEAEKSPILDNYSSDNIMPEKITLSQISKQEKGRINDILYRTFKNAMTANPNMVMLGEDIELKTKYTPKSYGGAFKVSKDLSMLFEGRANNTPISEPAITGVATGMAIGGLRPMAEIMFGDFSTLIFDQIMNHASKFYSMYNKQLDVPLIVRTPMGGRRGYGPTHSQSLEKYFLGIPNIKIIALNNRISPEIIYGRVFTEKQPVFVIENKVLYTRMLNTKEIPGFEIQQTDEEYPTLKISPKGAKPDITLLCYGGMLEEAEKIIDRAFDEAEIICELVCPVLISPYISPAVIDSVKQTKRLLTIEEGSSYGAYSSEVFSVLAEKKIALSYAKRLANNDVIASSYHAELNQLPDAEKIFQILKSDFKK